MEWRGRKRLEETRRGAGQSAAFRPTLTSGVTIRVLIANHQPLIRCGLHAVVANDPDLRVVGETGAGAEAVRMTWQLRPDVVLMDLGLASMA